MAIPNSWHKTMYDNAFAKRTIGSPAWKKKSQEEAEFILRTLSLPSSARILDIPCGTGRHAVPFARAGHSVTAVDINKACLTLARQKNSHSRIHYLHGDMQKLEKYQEQFDVVTNLFSSFGYFRDDAENFRVLKQLTAAVKPGGFLVLNTVNRDWLMGIFQPASWHEDAKTLTVEARKYDPKTKYNESQSIVMDKRTGKARAYYHRIRFYSKSELVNLMKKAGLRNIRVFGDFHGGRFSRFTSTHPFYFGQKPL